MVAQQMVAELMIVVAIACTPKFPLYCSSVAEFCEILLSIFPGMHLESLYNYYMVTPQHPLPQHPIVLGQ